jgi:hypothetical protein
MYQFNLLKIHQKQFTLAAVKKDGEAIVFFHDHTNEIQLAAVNQNGRSIKYITNPSEEVQLAAVKQNGFAISYIKNPSEEVKLEAVKQYPPMHDYIYNLQKESSTTGQSQESIFPVLFLGLGTVAGIKLASSLLTKPKQKARAIIKKQHQEEAAAEETNMVDNSKTMVIN